MAKALDDKVMLEIMETLGRIDTRTAMLERVLLGNGQPGLAQKVEALEGSRNLLWGMGSAVTFIGGLAEWLFHRK
jgi:hypothetical protein